MTQSVSDVRRGVAGLGRRLGAAASRSVVFGSMLVGCASQPTEVVEPRGAVTTEAVVPAPSVANLGRVSTAAGASADANGADANGADNRTDAPRSGGARGERSTATSSGATSSGATSSGATSPGATSVRGAADAAVVSSFTWPSALLDARPASHVAAGKRRVAAIVVGADGKRRLLVVEVPEGDRNASHVKVRVDVPVPASLQTAPADSFSLFMGRDDWPRVIVAPPPNPGALTYHRYRPNEGWKSPADEQGALAAGGRAAGYYGVLGHADPEVLCVPDEACYEKRTSGWTKRAVPGPGVWEVTLNSELADPHDVRGWAWAPNAAGSVLQLDGEWRAPLPPLKEPLLGFATWGRAYFVALTPSGLYRHTPPATSAASETPTKRGAGAAPGANDSATAAWSVIAKVEDGGVLFNSPLLPGMLVGSKDALYRLASPGARLDRVWIEVNAQPLATGRVTAIGATLEQWSRYFVACDAGLIQLGDIHPDPGGPL